MRLKMYSKIGVMSSLIIVGYLAISNFNKNNMLFWVFTLAFLLGLLGVVFEFSSKQNKQRIDNK